MKRANAIIAAAFLLSFAAPPATAQQCCGDCDGDGAVGIANLIAAVRNALDGCPGAEGPPACCGDCDGDARVTINELVTAVGRALGACDPTTTPTPSSTPTATPTPTATATATPSHTPTVTETPIRAVDNGDGTVTDSASGLIWEKKVGGDGVPDGSNDHDADNRYPWRGRCQGSDADCLTGADCGGAACLAGDQQGTRLTIYTWVERLNGFQFAGFSDWRVPTLDELRSLRDLDEVPAIDPGFHAPGCGTACLELGDPDCSCTGAGPHWTSTEDETDAGRAWRIDFDDGAVVASNKGDDLRVRAVRGP